MTNLGDSTRLNDPNLLSKSSLRNPIESMPHPFQASKSLIVNETFLS